MSSLLKPVYFADYFVVSWMIDDPISNMIAFETIFQGMYYFGDGGPENLDCSSYPRIWRWFIKTRSAEDITTKVRNKGTITNEVNINFSKY